ETEPAEACQLLPEVVALSTRIVPQGAHDGRGHVLVEERASRPAQELLVGAEREVHEARLGSHAVGPGFLGQPEHALADDVLLDLRGTRVDRARPGPEERRGPG